MIKVGKERGGVSSAFTIVELLVVIVVIAILAVITVVAYNGIQKQAVASSLKDTLSSAAKAMEVAAVEANTYETLPNTITIPDGLGIALTQVGDPTKDFCINATTQRYDDMIFSFKKEDGAPEEGACEGSVLSGAGRMLGEYNASAGNALGYVPVTAGRAHAERYNFTVETNEAWTQVYLSWDQQTGTQRYEIQVRTSPSGVWNYVVKSSGAAQGSTCQVSSLVTCTGVAPPTTQLTWASRVDNLPAAAGQTFEYRMRSCADASSDNCGEWSTVSLANPIQASSLVPGVVGFSVTPNSGWTNVVLSWDAAPRYGAIEANARYQVQVRTSPSGVWNYVVKSSGAAQGSTCQVSSLVTCTGVVPPTTQLSWAARGDNLPTVAGQIFQYRIRNCADSTSDYCGAWNEVTLNNPVQSASSVPAVSGFSVTPSSDWTSVVLSWSATPNYGAIETNARYQVQVRTSPSGVWNYVVKSSGAAQGSTCQVSSLVTCTGVAPPTTQLNWTARVDNLPAAGQTFQYRIRNCGDLSSNYCGEWSEVSLSR